MLEQFQAISVVVIGEGSLPLQCGDLLLNQGHTIAAVVTQDRALQAWAQERQLPVYTEPGALAALLTATPVDYLLSISNPQIIPAAVLALPRCAAINYHDAPLPRYAGAFATSWAILQGETQHGITWHCMTAQVDGGDILQQRLVPIDSHDTAFTLNGKCFEAAIHAFTDLLHDLAHNGLHPIPQELNERSYFARHQRPPAGAVIDWQQPAEAIDRLCRALTFGPYPNPLASPKLLLGDNLFVVAGVEMGEVTDDAPGTLLALTTERITVATATRSLVIKKVLTLNGEAHPFSVLAERHGLQVGMALPLLTPPLAERLTAQNSKFCKHEPFWHNRLRALSLPDLPYRHPTRRTDASPAPVSLSLPVDTTTTAWLASQGWRPTEFFAAIFALYLGRVSRSTAFDLAFTPATLTAAIQDTAPFFAPQVPLHIELAADASFAQFYQTVAAEIDTVRRKGSYACDLVARQPDLLNNAEVQRWPQSALAIQETTTADCSLSPTSLLTLVICPTSGQPTIHFDPAQVDAAAMQRMVGHLQTLTAAVIADPSAPVATLPLLTAAERHQLLVEWNNTSTPYPQGKCLQHLFEEQAARTPEAIAVNADQVTRWQGFAVNAVNSLGANGDKVNESTPVTLSRLTYHDLDAHANQLAHYLQTLGIGPDMPVAVCLERSAALPMSFLGVLKAGGAYLPLDPAYPAERLGFILQDASAPVLLTQQSLLPALPTHGATVVCLDRDWPLIATMPCHAPTTPVTANDVAYIVYTSGSTGQPKGALLEHDGLCSITPAVIRLYELQVGSRLLQFISPGFDVAVSEMAMVLCSGATLVMADKERLQLGPALAQTLAEGAITHAELPPAVLATLDPTHFPLITTVITGGEVCPAEVVMRWSQGRKFFNAYGPTEATNTNTICDCRNYQPPTPGQSPSIGKPAANKVVYILNEHRQPVPVGVPGELYIGGVGIARGYLNRPELTAQRFVDLDDLPLPRPTGAPAPLLREGTTVPPLDRGRLGGGLRVYKTGDLVRWLPDGNIDFIGRIDTQVKLRGFRIELGEIENGLTTHPAVQQAVVIVREDQPGDKRLVAYVVQDKKTGRQEDQKTDVAQSLNLLISPTELRTFLQAKLPEHMVPAAIVMLESLPLTTHGKVDRRALPAPGGSLVKRQGRYMEPRSVEEFDLAALWEEVLGVQQISIDENFFALGGNSLLALQLIVKIREKFGKQYPMGTLLQYPTIVEFSPLLEQSSAPGLDRWVSLLPLQPKGNRPNFYCITPSGHDGIYFYPLAMALGEDQPFYALRLPSLSGLVPPPDSIEEAATFYYQEIKRVQPHGPYHLAGHSFGGVVAFELAQQMHRAGETVGFLGLFDCEPGDYSLVKPLNVLNYTMNFVNYFVNTYGRPGQSEIPIHREMTLETLATFSIDERVEWAYEVLRQTYAPQAENLDEVRGMLLSAIAGFQYIYQPTAVVSLPFTFFVAGDLKPEDAERRIDYWSGLGVIDVCTIPGDHESMLTNAQNRALLAHELGARLQAAYERDKVTG